MASARYGGFNGVLAVFIYPANSDNLSPFEQSPEELDGTHDELVAPTAILACLSQLDETAFSRARNSKRGRLTALEIVVVRFPINF
jgi:hypothetical protein